MEDKGIRPFHSMGVFGWLWEESEKRGISERKCKKREIYEKYSRFEVLIDIREKTEKQEREKYV
jgi:hypothetical protein